MKLNIYERHEIVKTYEATAHRLPWGVLSDIIHAVDLDSFQSGSDSEIIKAVGKLMLTSMDVVEELMYDIFEGLTPEELKKADTGEIAAVIIDVVMHVILQIESTFSGISGNFRKVSSPNR